MNKSLFSRFSKSERVWLAVFLAVLISVSFLSGVTYAKPTLAHDTTVVASALTETETNRPTLTSTQTSTSTATSSSTVTRTSIPTATLTSTPFPEAVQTLLASITTATAKSLFATETSQQLALNATATRSLFERNATATEAARPVPTESPLTKPHSSGVYVVGIDIAPGRWQVTDPTYITTSLASQPNCYWAIYNVVGNLNRDDYGQAPPFVIDVYAADAFVEFDGCGLVKYLGP